MFGPEEPDIGSQYLIKFRENQLKKAHAQFLNLLEKSSKIKGRIIINSLLENEFVWKSDVDKCVFEMVGTGAIEIEGLKPRERALKDYHIIQKI